MAGKGSGGGTPWRAPPGGQRRPRDRRPLLYSRQIWRPRTRYCCRSDKPFLTPLAATAGPTSASSVRTPAARVGTTATSIFWLIAAPIDLLFFRAGCKQLSRKSLVERWMWSRSRPCTLKFATAYCKKLSPCDRTRPAIPGAYPRLHQPDRELHEVRPRCVSLPGNHPGLGRS